MFLIDASVFSSLLDVFLDGFKLEVELLAAADRGEIELPELAREAERRPVLVQVNNELEAERPPKIGKTHVRVDWFKFDVGIKRKRGPGRHKTGKGITIEMIPVRWVGGPIRI